MTSWKLETRKKKCSTNKWLRLKTKLIFFLKRKKWEEEKWSKPLKKVGRTKLIVETKKSQMQRERRWSSLSSGNSETKSWPLLSNKKEKRKDSDVWNWPTTSRNKLKIRIWRLRRISLTNSIRHSTTKLSRINRRRIFTHMPRSVFKNGRARARMSSQSFWSSKTTRRKSYEKYCNIYHGQLMVTK